MLKNILMTITGFIMGLLGSEELRRRKYEGTPKGLYFFMKDLYRKHIVKEPLKGSEIVVYKESFEEKVSKVIRGIGGTASTFASYWWKQFITSPEFQMDMLLLVLRNVSGIGLLVSSKKNKNKKKEKGN